MMLLSKFRGSLVGAAIGDCFGKPFEYVKHQEKRVSEMFQDAAKGSLPAGSLLYTDDTVMMRCIAESWIDKKSFCAKDLAKRFTKEYFEDVHAESRWYGEHVVKIFNTWKTSGVDDVFTPATQQFNGSGSFGNGGAMRVAPVALICANKDIDQVVQLAKNTALLTHTNWEGYNGAILQALAVWRALQLNSCDEFDRDQYITSLISDMQSIEKNNPVSEGKTPFSDKLTLAKDLLSKPNVTAADVAKQLGNAVTAKRSVASAVYCFLRAMQPVDFLQNTSNAFERAITLAILLEGDTDTIACMTGAIAGAYYGLDKIPSYLQTPCEKIEEIDQLAKSIYELQLGPISPSPQ